MSRLGHYTTSNHLCRGRLIPEVRKFEEIYRQFWGAEEGCWVQLSGGYGGSAAELEPTDERANKEILSQPFELGAIAGERSGV